MDNTDEILIGGQVGPLGSESDEGLTCLWVSKGWLHVEHEEASDPQSLKVKTVRMKVGDGKDRDAVVALLRDPNMWVTFLSSLSTALNSNIEREVIVD